VYSTIDISVLRLAAPKKSLRVKWVDHFGGDLSASKIIEGDDTQVEQEADSDPSVSWSDRKKRDRLREKELLAKAKYVYTWCVVLCCVVDEYF
jgi:hypothetical protein